MMLHQTWLSIGFFMLGVQFACAQAPQRTTSVYDDWIVSCVVPGAGVQKSCEIVNHQIIQGQPNPAGQITLNLPARAGPFKVFFQVHTLLQSYG